MPRAEPLGREQLSNQVAGVIDTGRKQHFSKRPEINHLATGAWFNRPQPISPDLLVRKEDSRTIEAIIWRLDNGAKWRSILAELGNWHHAYLRFRRWAVNGVWDEVMAHVVPQGEPKLAFACIDGTVARAHQKASGTRSGKPTH